MVSGCGTPRNKDHLPIGNSTECLAELMAFYVKTYSYPSREIETIVVDSGPGLFTFGANVRFVQGQLEPMIAKKRRELAIALGEKVRRLEFAG